MPWRLWTPQVSVPRMSLHTLGAMMEKPRVLKVPAQRPMTMAKPGLTEEQVEPMHTPPARAALAMSSTSIFPRMSLEKT